MSGIDDLRSILINNTTPPTYGAIATFVYEDPVIPDAKVYEVWDKYQSLLDSTPDTAKRIIAANQALSLLSSGTTRIAQRTVTPAAPDPTYVATDLEDLKAILTSDKPTQESINAFKNNTTSIPNEQVDAVWARYQEILTGKTNPTFDERTAAADNACRILTGSPSGQAKKAAVAVVYYQGVLNIVRPIWGTIDYATGAAPPSTGGLLLIARPGEPSQSTAKQQNLQPECSHEDRRAAIAMNRTGQVLSTGSNLVYAFGSRPVSGVSGDDSRTTDVDGNTSTEKVDLYEGYISEMMSMGNQANLGHTLLLLYVPNPNAPVANGLEMTADAAHMGALYFVRTAGNDEHPSPGVTMQTNVETDLTNSLISAAAEEEGEDIGASQSLNVLFPGVSSEVIDHGARTAMIPLRIDLQTNANEFGTGGSVMGVIANGTLYLLGTWAPWANYDEQDHQDANALADNGRLTRRGELAIWDGVDVGATTAIAFIANGESEWMNGLAITDERFQDAVTAYYPRLQGPVSNQAIIGSEEVLGTDPMELGNGIIIFYQHTKDASQAITAGLRDGRDPKDPRRWPDYWVNTGIDVINIAASGIYTGTNSDQLEDGTKSQIIATSITSALLRQGLYWLTYGIAKTYFENNAVAENSVLKHMDIGLGLTPDGQGMTASVTLPLGMPQPRADNSPRAQLARAQASLQGMAIEAQRISGMLEGDAPLPEGTTLEYLQHRVAELAVAIPGVQRDMAALQASVLQETLDYLGTPGNRNVAFNGSKFHEEILQVAALQKLDEEKTALRAGEANPEAETRLAEIAQLRQDLDGDNVLATYEAITGDKGARFSIGRAVASFEQAVRAEQEHYLAQASYQEQVVAYRTEALKAILG